MSLEKKVDPRNLEQDCIKAAEKTNIKFKIERKEENSIKIKLSKGLSFWKLYIPNNKEVSSFLIREYPIITSSSKVKKYLNTVAQISENTIYGHDNKRNYYSSNKTKNKF